MSQPSKAPLDFRNTNSVWGSVLAETLVRLGVAQAVISPGSRSTPLTIAFARNPGIEAIPLLDERSAAFFALGLARSTHRPVVLLCTSGTAGANYFPAIIEAQESGVPLLVITADRPPEMRQCRSGQTIDQQKLFGSQVNFYHELAVPEASVRMLRYLRQTVAHAVERTQWPVAGPVHLNAPFRDPLPPVEDGTAAGLKKEIDEDFFAHLTAGPMVREPAEIPDLPQVKRGLIVTGPAQPRDPTRFANTLELLSGKTGWPVLADSLSPMRSCSASGMPFITAYDILARNAELMEKLRPDFVLCVGGWPISKTLRAWLEQCDAPTWIISESEQNQDALHGRTRTIRASIERLAESLPDPKELPDYFLEWLYAQTPVHVVLNRELAGLKWMFEGKASWLMSALLPEHTPVLWPTACRCGTWNISGRQTIATTPSTAIGARTGSTARCRRRWVWRMAATSRPCCSPAIWPCCTTRMVFSLHRN